MRMLTATLATFITFGAGQAFASLDSWISTQHQLSVEFLNQNISIPGSIRGTIIASPARSKPNYYFYWVRDGAMVMRAIFDLHANGDQVATQQMRDFVQYTRENQRVARAKLGEPRFNIDGTIDTKPWARPQNDGPALRALTLIRYARSLLTRGDRTIVERELYVEGLPTTSPVKVDLEFVAHHWQETCFDIWEEVRGMHFFTRATQLAALREGAKFANEMNDPLAAKYYVKQANLLEVEMAKHWDEQKGYYLSALQLVERPGHLKPSQRDVSVLIGALFAEQEDGILSLADDRMIRTANAIEDAFAKLYKTNIDHPELGTAIGRFTEDVYFGGNPWILTTLAYGEWNYRLASKILSAKKFVLTEVQAAHLSKIAKSKLRVGADLATRSDLKALVSKALLAKGDSYMERVRFHVEPLGGHMAEQFDRNTGAPKSAPHLSWSYAAFMRTAEARTALLEAQ